MKKHILFVDDEPNFLEGLRRMLRNQRELWDMSFVNKGAEALDKLQKEEVDAVVSDAMMPEMDGFELLENIRKTAQTKDVPVIMLTGSNEHNLKQRALNLGATDLLNKPVDQEDLLARIRNTLRLKSYQDEIKAQNELLEQKVKLRTRELEISRMDIIFRLGKIAEFRDETTGNHIVRVGHLSRAIAEELGLKSDFIENMFLTSPLHDIGKIGVPDNILLKRGKLTSDEFDIMKQHCAIGAEILKQDNYSKLFLENCSYEIEENPLLIMASSIALTHHEKWNGNGYPSGLEGEDIPIESRIVAIVDVYDALRSIRPYKPAFSESKSRAIIQEEIGKHFDPQVYSAFEKCINKIEEIRTKLPDELRPGS